MAAAGGGTQVLPVRFSGSSGSQQVQLGWVLKMAQVNPHGHYSTQCPIRWCVKGAPWVSSAGQHRVRRMCVACLFQGSRMHREHMSILLYYVY